MGRSESSATDPRDVWAQYRRTLIRITVRNLALGVQLVNEPAISGGCAGPWPFDRPVVVLTAWNPGSRPRATDVNTAAQMALEEELRAAGHVLWESEASAVDGSWREPGVAVPGMALQEAVATGVRYGQRALYQLDAAAAAVVGCTEAGRVERCWWRSRWEQGAAHRR